MSAAKATAEKPQMMRLGAIEERRALNPRGKLDHKAVQEYVRRLRNGETPPPLKVCRRTNVLFAGAQRLQAYKEFFGATWEAQEVPVLLQDGLPDPETEPLLFTAQMAAENRNHGVRVDRLDRKRILKDICAAYGIEKAMALAPVMNETHESLEELLGILARPHQAREQAIQSMPEATPPAPVEGADCGGGEYRPEAFPLSHLRSTRPAIKRYAEGLLQALELYSASLTGPERELLGRVHAAIGRVLHGGTEAAD